MLPSASELYISYVNREIHATMANLVRNTRFSSEKPHSTLNSVYLGGGTPSLMEPVFLRSILENIKMWLPLDRDTEVTMEMDPATFDQKKLDAFLQAGVNRVSLGVQSFTDSILQGAGRFHSSIDALTALDWLESHSVNTSVDLISGLPGLTLPVWTSSLRTALERKIHHISVYDLEVSFFYSEHRFPAKVQR